MTLTKRNNIRRLGAGDRVLLMAHGFGCDQNMWRFLTPFLEQDFDVVLFDYVGWGQSDLAAYEPERYTDLSGYAQDVIEICDELELTDVIFVGHSVSAMIGLLASLERPHRFSSLVMVCPSPYFLNDPPDYYGGFDHEDIEELFELMDKNFLGWAHHLAPLVAGASADEALRTELEGSFCSTDPVIAKRFARATFYADLRDYLPRTSLPTLLLQATEDSLASPAVGEYMHDTMPASVLRVVEANGHCLHMTHPEIVAHALYRFLEGSPRAHLEA